MSTSKRPFDAVSSSSSDGLAPAFGEGMSTAATSAVATPVFSGGQDPTAVLGTSIKSVQPIKQLKLRYGQSVKGDGGSGSGDKAELDQRRDAFLRAHAPTFEALLPDKNHIKSLLKQYPDGTVHREAIPYRKLAQPSIIQGQMKDYQLIGLSWMAFMWENGQNCILADEMGLGKTLQTLSLIAYLYETHGTKGPHLLVCPLSVLGSWCSEIARWLPSFTMLRFHGPMNERGRLRGEVSRLNPDLVVTTYEAYTAESAWFKNRKWGLCVLDEGHKIKNHESMASLALQGIPAQMRLILSGTPLQNNLIELWALLHFLYPQVFTVATLKSFKDAFNLTAGLYDQSFLKRSQALLELIMLRRTKDGVRAELSVPPREEMTLYVPLSPAQRFWYKRLLTRADTVTLNEIFDTQIGPEQQNSKRGRKSNAAIAAAAAQAEAEASNEGDEQVKEQVKKAIAAAQAGGDGNAWMKMMNLLMQLRKCCNHPYLLPNAEAEPFEVAEHIVAASSKLVLLDKLLNEIMPKGEKVLIFSGFTRMLDILEDFMQLRGHKYARLDGSTTRPRRALDIKLFQQKTNSPYQCYLISTRAGGLGINLTAATTVVLFDQDWNPQVDIQAISRAHRIGQTKLVQVYRLVCQDSVEEQALTRLRKKLYLSAKVMGSMKNAADRPADELVEESPAENEQEDDAPKMTRGELAGILRGGASALAKWGTDGSDPFAEFRSATFDELRERGKKRDEKKEVGIKLEIGDAVSEEQKRQLELEEEQAEKLLLQGREAVQARKFEGATYKATNIEIRNEWQATLARSSNERTVMIDGHPVLKETLNNGSWEAVKTITGGAERKPVPLKKKRAKFDHEDFCLVCKDGGEVYQCASCPRSCHGPCSGFTKTELNAMMSYYCPQHGCTFCRRTTQEAGGLLFRCQTCPSSFCEDCLPPDDIEAVGDVLPEFALLGCFKRPQAYFIRCNECIELFATVPEIKENWDKEQAEIHRQLEEKGIEI